MRDPSNDRAGRSAEARAVWLLRAKAYRILARRFRSMKGTGAGEIDIVARKGRLIAFVEVKARPTQAQALEAIGARQQARLVRAAERFVTRFPRFAAFARRFDAVLVTGDRWLPLHVKDAFRP